ncbi:MAG: hypothetical protein O6705_09105, partial [Actinobacteria bacterium]|nr:hypothetical protein [Actinomycetota bacterium]
MEVALLLGTGAWGLRGGVVRRALIAFAIFGVLLLAVPAVAADVTILIQIDGIVRGAEGEIFEVAVQAVDPDLVGARCSAGTAQTEVGGS